MLLSSLLFSITLSTAPTAIPGVLDGPNIEAEPPKIWVYTGNDNLCPPRSEPDDHRTFTFSGGFRIDDHFIILGDDSALTEKNTTHTRIDQLTFALGYIVKKNDFTITPTIGIRLNGNFGGNTIQSDFHSLIEPHQPQVVGVYERAPNVFFSGLSIEYNKELFRFLYDDTQFSYGYSARAVSLITTSGETQSALQFTIYSEQMTWYSYYFGLRNEFRGGNTRNTTAQQVANIERGRYFIMGTTLDDVIYMEWGIGMNTSFAYGIIGVERRF